jgi:hypothetical protein
MDSITTEAECNHAAAVLGLMEDAPPSYARLSPDTPYTYRSGRKCSGDVVSVGDALAAQGDLGDQFFGTDLSAHKWSFGEAVAACDGAASCTGVVNRNSNGVQLAGQDFALCDTEIVDDSYSAMKSWEKAWVYTKELEGNYGCPDGGSDAFPDAYPTWRAAARACDVSSQCVAIIDHGAQGLTLCSYGAVASNPPEKVAFSVMFSHAVKTVWAKPGHVVAQNEYVRSRAGFKCDSAHLISSPLYDSNGSPSSFATAAAKCDSDPSCAALYDNKDDGVGFFVCVVGFTLEQARALRLNHCHHRPPHRPPHIPLHIPPPVSPSPPSCRPPPKAVPSSRSRPCPASSRSPRSRRPTSGWRKAMSPSSAPPPRARARAVVTSTATASSC